MVLLRDKFRATELFAPRGLMREKELESMVALCVYYNKKVDLNSDTYHDIQGFLEDIELENAPKTNLIKREEIMLRDPGMFKSWTDCKVVLTKDNFLHAFEMWKSKKDKQI